MDHAATKAGGGPTATRLFAVSFLIGIFSFGGGLTAWMLREFVEKRGWLTEADFMNDLAVSRALPGTNVTNMIVIMGYRVHGPRGAIAGLIGLLSGPFLAVIGLVTAYDFLSGPTFDAAVEGAAAAALGASGVIAIKSVTHAVRRWHSILLIAAIVVAAFFFKVPLVLLVLVALPVSLALGRVSGAGHGK